MTLNAKWICPHHYIKRIISADDFCVSITNNYCIYENIVFCSVVRRASRKAKCLTLRL